MDRKENNMLFDIGIVGWWFASNYGSALTYFAMANILSDIGKKPLFIPCPKIDGGPWDKDTQITINFLKKYFTVGKERNFTRMREYNDFVDSFIVGSDQMWRPSTSDIVGHTFYLDFVDSHKKKIAFSTSFGQNSFNCEQSKKDIVIDLIRRFDAISVRENNGVDICRNEFGVEAEQSFDPIFLCPAEKYLEAAKDVKAEVPNGYLVAYILDPTPEKEEAVRIIAEKKNKKVITILGMKEHHWAKDRWHVGTVLPQVSVEEFIYYISKSDYVFTDSHHGTCLSIILKKDYAVFVNENRGGARFETVASALGLNDRLIYKLSDLDKMSEVYEPINYTQVMSRLSRETMRAASWLHKALKQPPKVSVETVNTMRARCMALEYDLRNAQKAAAPQAPEYRITANKPSPAAENFDFIKIRLLATLLRDYGIKHIVLSPGGRDVPIIRMFEYNEHHFVLHRVTDERSAAYFALGLAAQLKAPVACVCTSGTAASNYLPAVTEAYYTGIPLIVITADRYGVYLNHGEDQTIPQKDIYRDVVKMAVSLPEQGGYLPEYQARRDISTCILETTHNGWGPVHINVPVQDISVGAGESRSFWSLTQRINPHILRVGFGDGEKEMYKWVDSLKKSKRILVVYGQNPPLNNDEQRAIEAFAQKYNCVITTDTISNLNSPYALETFNMLNRVNQADFDKKLSPDIVITVGGKRLMNDPLTFKLRGGKGIRHWSVTPDGKVKDFYFKLTSVIECTSAQFFRWFADHAGNIKNNNDYFNVWKKMVADHPVTPVEGFNSFYIQNKFLPAVPSGSMLHLGVGQTFFFARRYTLQKDVEVFCNMGTNGIDGCTSTFMGQCAVERDRLCFLLVGDLSFFYDMNSIWNKQLNKNVRILLVNNNGSGLLRNHNLKAITSVHNTKAENWVKSVGFEYMSASSPKEFDEKIAAFLSPKSKNPLFFEVFCD